MEINFLDDSCPSFSSILANISKGDYWVDNKINPSIAIAYSYCVGGYGILGSSEIDNKYLENFIADHIFTNLNGRKSFEFSTENKALKNQLLSIYESKDIKSELEHTYRLSSLVTEDFYLKPIYKVRKVSKELLQNITHFSNYSLITKRIDKSWYSYNDFFKYSLAYISTFKNEIVGICFGSALYNNFIAVDIETNIKHRQNGIATNLAKSFINDAISRNYTIHWDCVDSNIASRKLAIKLGFDLFKVRPYYWFKK